MAQPRRGAGRPARNPLPVRTQYRVAPEAAVVALVTLAFITCGGWMAAGYDTGRDMAAAFAIVHDGARPLEGPLFAGRVQLGPLWYYLLALPLWIWPTWLAGALMASVLTALQFPLAYLAGTRLADRRLGLLWVAALVLPGWGSFQAVGFASPNLVATSVVGCVYALVRARTTPHVGWWLLAGLAAAIGIHAHPTAAWLVPLVGWQALRHPGAVARHFRDAVVALAAVALGFALPFVPLLAAGAHVLANVAQVTDAQAGVQNLARVPSLLLALATEGAPTLVAMLAPGSRLASLTALAATAVGVVGVIFALGAAFTGERIARAALLFTLLATVFVAWLRPSTPLYMLYTIVPLYALAVATGWHWLLRRRAAWLVVVPALACGAVAGALLVRAQHTGGALVDGPRIVNVTAARAPAPAADVWLPALRVDTLGRWLCAHPGATHGVLPYLLDVHYTLPLRMHCPAAIAAFTDVTSAGNGHLGLARARLRELGIDAPTWIGGIGIVPVAAVIAAPRVHGWVLDDRYPPHAYATGAQQRRAFTFTQPRGRIVVASNPQVGWMDGWQTVVTCNGNVLAPAAADAVTRSYRCPGDATDNAWAVAVTAALPDAVEIVAIDTVAGAR